MLSTVDATFEVSPDGNDFAAVPGVANVNESDSEVEVHTRQTFAAPVCVTGSRQPTTIEVALPRVSRGHPTYDRLLAAFNDRRQVFVRYTVLGELIDDLRDIDTRLSTTPAGVCTFTGTVPPPRFGNGEFEVGEAFLTGGGRISVITALPPDDQTNVVAVAPATAGITAERYAVIDPGFRRPSFEARVVKFDELVLDAESAPAAQLTLRSRTVLPALELRPEYRQ